MPQVYDKVRVDIRKPDWLKIGLRLGEEWKDASQTVKQSGVHTICESGRCPNRIECWGRRTATFMVLGGVCTRGCGFCGTSTGVPLPPDSTEPDNVARAVERMGLKYVVITSVTRDDLRDGGALHWAQVIRAVKALGVTVEVLIPDLSGADLGAVLAASPDVVGHNIETVSRLTPHVRSKASYSRSLGVLGEIAERGFVAKSGLMVGLGESSEEVVEALRDLREAGVSAVTIGQYLRPSRKHLPVAEYVAPEQFEKYKQEALRLGFAHVAAGPLVRSSYMAEQALPALAALGDHAQSSICAGL